MRVLAVVLFVACSAPATAPAPPVVANRAPAPAAPAPPTCAEIHAGDAKALASKTDAVHAIDLDADPATEERFVEDDCSGLRCTFRVYAQRAGCWQPLGEVQDLMDAPYCERGGTPGAYCTLSGMRLMIHGDAQQYLFAFAGAYGAEEPGPRYVPGPSKKP